MIASSRQPVAAYEIGPALVIGAAVCVAVFLVWFGVSRPDLVHLDVPASPRGLTIATLGAAAALTVVRHRRFGLCVLIAVVYLNVSDVLVRHGLPSLLQLLSVPVAAAAWIGSTRESRRTLGSPLTLLLVGYGLVLLASTTYARDRLVADARAIEHAKGVAMYVAIVLLLSSTNAVRLGFWTMSAAATILAAFGTFQAATGRTDLTLGGLARVEQAQIVGTHFEPRIAGPVGDPNFFAQILVIVVPLVVALAWTETSRRYRALALACVALVVAGIVCTYSRGGGLALCVVLGLSLLDRRIDRRYLAMAGAGLAVLLILLPADFTRRLGTVSTILPGHETTLRPDSSFELRKLWVQTAWHIFLDHPLAGVGGGNYAAYYDEYSATVGSVNREFDRVGMAHYPHNLYLEVAAETGLVGVVVFGFVLLTCFVTLARARRAFLTARDERMAALARATAIALTGYLVSSLFLHGAFQRYLWLLLAFAVALDGIAKCCAPSHLAATGRNAARRLAAVPELAGRQIDRALPAAGPRRAIAVLLSRFPLVTETFILRELEELERQGQPVRLVPLRVERGGVMHREAKIWLSRAFVSPFFSWGILAANTRVFREQPCRYVFLLCRLLVGSLQSPNVLVRTLALFPKSVYLAEQLQREGIRHVYAHYATHPATAAFVISSLAPISISFTAHAHDLFVAWRRPLLRAKVRRARFVRVISEFNRSFMVGLYPESATKIRVIHVGVDPSVYCTATSSAGLEPAADSGQAQPQLLCVASLQPYKGIAVLIEACRRLTQAGFKFKCDIVGEGWLRPSLEDAIARGQLGDRVRLRGALRQDQVAELLRQASVVVLPSVVAPDGQMEGIPVALMEAMATERPVVASALSGIPELIDHGVNGLMVEPGNPEAFGEAIATLLCDSQLRREMGRRGREKVLEAFRLDACTSSLLDELDRHNPPADEVEWIRELARRAGFSGHQFGVRSVHERHDSHVVEMVASDGRQIHDLIVKSQQSRPGESRPAGERARYEYEVLERLRGCFPNGDGGRHGVSLGVPRPLGIQQSDAAIVMTRCRGALLDDLIRRARAGNDPEAWTALEHGVMFAGQWLSQLQKATWRPDAAAAEQAWKALIEGARRHLAVLEEQCVSRWMAARIRDRLESTSRVVGAAGAVAGCHGDFLPGNVFVTPSSVDVIDFEGYHEGPTWLDATYFLVHLELYFARPWLKTRLRRLQDAFLRGFGTEPAADPAAYELCRTVAGLKALARLPAWGWWRHFRTLQHIVAGKPYVS